MAVRAAQTYFYPRSPCGERRPGLGGLRQRGGISIHALLAESDNTPSDFCSRGEISIHALLAESDLPSRQIILKASAISIHALLAESDIAAMETSLECKKISIHALLAESDQVARRRWAIRLIFLSTLSLRRATKARHERWKPENYFYPRSPCGERRPDGRPKFFLAVISIHALLAESDSWVLRLRPRC